MDKQFQELKAREVLVEIRVRQLFKEALEYELHSAECQVLESLDLLVNVERALSATEKFLIRQRNPDLARTIGLTINRILKEKLALALMNEFELPVADVSFLQPTTPEKFSLFVLIDRQRPVSSQQLRPQDEGYNAEFLGA